MIGRRIELHCGLLAAGVGWMDYSQVGVALKMTDVEGENTIESVGLSSGYKAGVMGLLASYLVINNEFAP